MKVPDTSKAAYKKAKVDLIATHEAKIIEALSLIGVGNYELIGAKCKIDKVAVARRLKKLRDDGKVFQPGSKSKTKSGNLAYDYQCREGYVKKVEHRFPLGGNVKPGKAMLGKEGQEILFTGKLF